MAKNRQRNGIDFGVNGLLRVPVLPNFNTLQASALLNCHRIVRTAKLEKEISVANCLIFNGLRMAEKKLERMQHQCSTDRANFV